MTTNNASREHPKQRTLDFAAIVEAMCAAVSAAVLEHKKKGAPIVIWRNGRIEWILSEQIPGDGDLSKLA